MNGRLGRSARRRDFARGAAREQTASQQFSSPQQSLLSLPLPLLLVVPLQLLLSVVSHLHSRYTGIYCLSQSVKGQFGDWGCGYSDRAVGLEASVRLFYIVQLLATYQQVISRISK